MTYPPALAEQLYLSLGAVWPGIMVEFVQQCDSTNTRLLERARLGDSSACLLVAATQTAGRGRLNRPWLSSPGDSLTFSMAVPLSPPDWSGLSLAVGVALAQALHPRVGLKWPNDLWLDDRKLAGILIETAGTRHEVRQEVRQVVVGVGINIRARESAGLATAPAWLQELVPGVEAADVLAQVAAPVLRALRDFGQQGFGPWREGFARRDVLAGRTVSLSDGTQGRCQGIGPQGALLVHTDQGLREVTSSEVSVRPVA